MTTMPLTQDVGEITRPDGRTLYLVDAIGKSGGPIEGLRQLVWAYAPDEAVYAVDERLFENRRDVAYLECTNATSETVPAPLRTLPLMEA